MAEHYIDNKKFYAALKEHRINRETAISLGESPPLVSNYIGECILAIANRFATKPNFINYPFKDEMIADGVENCITYIDNFDPAKSDNPFAYFTQITYFAFLRRIQKEKKHLYIKHQALKHFALTEELFDTQDVDSDEYSNVSFADNEKVNEFIKSFEEGLEKKKKVSKVGLDKFFDKE